MQHAGCMEDIHFDVLKNNKNVRTRQLQHSWNISVWPPKCISRYRVTRVPPTADHVKPNAAPSTAQMNVTAIKPRLRYFPRLASKHAMLSISFAAGEKQVAYCEENRVSVLKNVRALKYSTSVHWEVQKEVKRATWFCECTATICCRPDCWGWGCRSAQLLTHTARNLASRGSGRRHFSNCGPRTSRLHSITINITFTIPLTLKYIQFWLQKHVTLKYVALRNFEYKFHTKSWQKRYFTANVNNTELKFS